MWDELGIAPCDDPKAIRRAYAARLKKLDPDRDPEAFMRLRAALEWALTEAETSTIAPSPHAPASETPTDPADATKTQDEAEDVRFPVSPTQDRPDRDARPIREAPPSRPPGSDAGAEWIDLAVSDRALVAALDEALDRGDAAEAMKRYYRAAASGAVSLQDTPALADRLFAIAVGDRSIDGAALRELAYTFGWDKPAHGSDGSDLRQRVLARLAAQDWYDSLVATAERRGGATRKQAKLARLMLGRIGRYWRPRVDRDALRTQLDAYRTHEPWLHDRIDPAWVRTLEDRWRRREIAVLVVLCLFVAGLLIDGVVVFIAEGRAGTLSLWMVPLALFFAAFLLWPLKLMLRELKRLWKPPPEVSDADPPDDPDARLRWLEQQAELAYQAMYDAPAGSTTRYNDAKEFLYDAIGLAERLGHAVTAERLTRRLAEIKAVFRTQFPGA